MILIKPIWYMIHIGFIVVVRFQMIFARREENTLCACYGSYHGRKG